ncbi:MAG: hypothetical protein ABIS51_16305 [Sphingomonas sp.]
MDTRQFSEAEWRDIFDEFRFLVQRAGYADWDLAMELAIEERRIDSEDVRLEAAPDQPALDELRRYAGEFMRFLKSRSRWTLDQQRERLGNFLRTDEGQPVDTFAVAFGDDQRSLYERTDDIDAMIENLRRFVAEIHGDDSGFWDEATDRPDGER